MSSDQKKDFLDSLVKHSDSDLKNAKKLSKYCRIAMFFDVGILIGCLVLAIFLFYSIEYKVHISIFLFCMSFFGLCLSLQEYFLMKCNHKLSGFLSTECTNILEMQQTVEFRESIREATEKLLIEMKDSIVSAHLVCKHKSALLVVVYSSGASAVPKKMAVLQEELNNINEGVSVHILHTSDNGKMKVPEDVLPPGSLRFVSNKEFVGWKIV